jgi:hypothetical protein
MKRNESIGRSRFGLIQSHVSQKYKIKEKEESPVETLTKPKEFVENPQFRDQKQKMMAGLHDDMLDAPIIDLINGFNQLPYCFTLQCCYGHFVHDHQKDPYNLEPLPITDMMKSVEYRIAYIAFCIENSTPGRMFRESLSNIRLVNQDNIQFCSAEWFWERQVNSYALQVQPDRFKDKDKSILDYKEALLIEKVRNAFFVQLQILLRKLVGSEAFPE